MRLILVRHGATHWNEIHKFQGFSDIELSPKGMAQARSLAESLRGEPLEAIFASPLKRARQTAEQIVRYQKCPLIFEDGLKELNQGKFEGLTGEELRKDYPDFFKNWLQEPGILRLPEGESLGELQQRAWSSMEKILRLYPGGTVAVVAHSFVNLTILCQVLGLPLTYFRRLRQDATAKNIIEFTERGAVVHCLNDTCHLVGSP
jgi:broad specificity phosphatase PhoE